MDHEKPGRFVATASSVGDLEVTQFDLQSFSEGVDVLGDGTASGEVMRLKRHGNVQSANCKLRSGGVAENVRIKYEPGASFRRAGTPLF